MTPDSRLCIRLFAAFDLPIVACLAVPDLAALFMQALSALGVLIGWAPLAPVDTPLSWLFVHVAGVLGVLWALARLTTPSVLLGTLDVLGRCLVAALIVAAMRIGNVSGVLWLLVMTELTGAVAQAWLLVRAWRRY